MIIANAGMPTCPICHQLVDSRQACGQFGCPSRTDDELARLRAEKAELEAQVAALAGVLKEIRPALGYGWDPAGGKTLGNIVDDTLNNLPASAERYLKVMEAVEKRRTTYQVYEPDGGGFVTVSFSDQGDVDRFLDAIEALTTKTENAG